jgi:hypothetical protein
MGAGDGVAGDGSIVGSTRTGRTYSIIIGLSQAWLALKLPQVEQTWLIEVLLFFFSVIIFFF